MTLEKAEEILYKAFASLRALRDAYDRAGADCTVDLAETWEILDEALEPATWATAVDDAFPVCDWVGVLRVMLNGLPAFYLNAPASLTPDSATERFDAIAVQEVESMLMGWADCRNRFDVVEWVK